jgi:hypothetical protein
VNEINAFQAPPTNMSTYREWTIGPIYYSALVIAEVLGSSNQSQVIDLAPNGDNEFTPGYAIYKNGSPTKVALFNYLTDPSGAHDYTADVQLGGGNTTTPGFSPSQVKVKWVGFCHGLDRIRSNTLSRYFRADSVASKDGITWGNQVRC